MGFVGFIGQRSRIPPDVGCAIGRNGGGSIATVALGPPSGVSIGDPMVACVSAGHYAEEPIGDYLLTPAAGWSTVHADPSGFEILSNLYTKIADGDDAAGTSSYTWTFTHGASLSGIVVSHLSWEAKYGATVSNASVDHTSSPSLSSPGGRWQFSYIVQRTRSAFGQPSPEPVVTSPATLLCENINPGSSGYRAGNLRAYASRNVSPISGAYSPGDSLPRYGLVVAAVSL